MVSTWREYKNTLLLVASLCIFIVFADTPMVQSAIHHIGLFGYIGSGVTGVFFVSTFTVAPASVVLFNLAQDYNPLLIAITAGFGAMLGDLLIFRLFKDQVFIELAPLAERIRSRPMFLLFKTPHFKWLTPVLGAIVIASPLPDELGIGMMGLSTIKSWQFAFLTYVLNTIGILLIVLVARV